MARIGPWHTTRQARLAGTALALALASASAAAGLPRVVSTNLCTDQLLLTLAAPEQIVSLSFLSADPQESVMAEAAAGYRLNYGAAEELLRLEPEVVLGGEYTRSFALGLLERLGTKVVTVAPARDLDGIARNLRTVARAIERPEQAETAIAEMRARASAIAAAAPGPDAGTVVVRPGGYTVGRDSLAHALMRLAGLENLAADQGLDRWGSLSVETLLRTRPDLLVLVDYHRRSPSLANAVFGHPALKRLERRTPTLEVEAAHFACGLPQSLAAVEDMQAAAKRALAE